MQGEDSCTPIRTRRCLGLRRTTQRSKILRTPLSDCTESYKSPLAAADTGSPLDFTSTNTASEKRSRTNTSHKLSLGIRIKAAVKKKRLEFTGDNNKKVDPPKAPPQQEILKNTAVRELSEEELEREIGEKALLLEDLKRHREKVEELQQVIRTWKSGFKSAVDELSSKPGAPPDKADLLRELRISGSMIKYLAE